MKPIEKRIHCPYDKYYGRSTSLTRRIVVMRVVFQGQTRKYTEHLSRVDGNRCSRWKCGVVCAPPASAWTPWNRNFTTSGLLSPQLRKSDTSTSALASTHQSKVIVQSPGPGSVRFKSRHLTASFLPHTDRSGLVASVASRHLVIRLLVIRLPSPSPPPSSNNL